MNKNIKKLQTSIRLILLCCLTLLSLLFLNARAFAAGLPVSFDTIGTQNGTSNQILQINVHLNNLTGQTVPLSFSGLDALSQWQIVGASSSCAAGGCSAYVKFAVPANGHSLSGVQLQANYGGRYPATSNGFNINIAVGSLQWQQNGAPITSVIDILGGSSGTFTLKNVGQGTVSNIQIALPSGVTGLTNNCEGKTLAQNASCSITYNNINSPGTGVYTFSATGTNANNSPQSFQVRILNNFLAFKVRPTFPGNTGAGGSVSFRYELENIGDQTADLNNISQSVTDGTLAQDATRTTCGSTLAPGATCWLAFKYLTPPNQGTATGEISIDYGGAQPLVDNTLAFNFENPVFMFITTDTEDKVVRCDVNPTTGNFSNCVDTGGTGFSDPEGITLNATGTIAFVGDFLDNTVSRCDVNPTTGDFSNCANTGGTGFDAPIGIQLNVSDTLAYIVNRRNNTVSRCDVNPTTGAFSNCANTGGTGFFGPADIQLNSSDTLAYIVNAFGGSVSRCDVNPTTGAFSNCADTGGTGFDNPRGIELNSSDTLAYISNVGEGNNTVSRCDVNPATGAFTNCADTGGTGFSSPFYGIELNARGTIAFVGNVVSDTVSRCDVNPTTGAFTNCADSGGTGFDSPYDIKISGDNFLN